MDGFKGFLGSRGGGVRVYFPKLGEKIYPVWAYGKEKPLFIHLDEGELMAGGKGKIFERAQRRRRFSKGFPDDSIPPKPSKGQEEK